MKVAVSILVLTIAVTPLFGGQGKSTATKSSSTADGSKKPHSFRDVPWGASEAQVKQKLVSGEDDCMELQDVRHCSTYFDLGDVRITAFLQFANDRFGQVLMWFPSDQFEFVKETFVEKYGRPTSARLEEVRTRMNVPYTNAILKWHWSDVDIFFERYGPDIEQGFASITTREYAAAEAERQKQKKRSAKNAF